MINFGNEKFTIDCPSCNRKHPVSIQQVANQATVHCFCGTNLKLQDKGGSAKKSIQSLNKLDDMFRKLGKEILIHNSFSPFDSATNCKML